MIYIIEGNPTKPLLGYTNAKGLGILDIVPEGKPSNNKMATIHSKGYHRKVSKFKNINNYSKRKR